MVDMDVRFYMLQNEACAKTPTDGKQG